MQHLDSDSQDTLDKRKARGEEILTVTWGRKVEGDDRHSAASDAISDILTLMCGVAGVHDVSDDGQGTYVLQANEYALNEARALIERSFESWLGDAEDYVVANPADPDQVEFSPERAALDS